MWWRDGDASHLIYYRANPDRKHQPGCSYAPHSCLWGHLEHQPLLCVFSPFITQERPMGSRIGASLQDSQCFTPHCHPVVETPGCHGGLALETSKITKEELRHQRQNIPKDKNSVNVLGAQWSLHLRVRWDFLGIDTLRFDGWTGLKAGTAAAEASLRSAE